VVTHLAADDNTSSPRDDEGTVHRSSRAAVLTDKRHRRDGAKTIHPERKVRCSLRPEWPHRSVDYNSALSVEGVRHAAVSPLRP